MNGKVTLGNIEDAEAFVRHCMGKVRIQLTDDEREELAAEGMAILVALHDKYDPTKDKMAGGKTGGFFGYALYLLPRKLGDAWHQMNPHHVLRTQPDGSRRYEYMDREISLDADERIRELEAPTGPDTRDLGDAATYRPPGSIASAVSVMRGMERAMATPVLHLLESGYNTREVARKLGVKYATVETTRAAISSAVWLVNQEAA